MSQKLAILIAVLGIIVCCVGGCKKHPTKPESMEQYRAEAKEEVTKKNMAKELGKIEKEIERDLSEEKQQQ
jgi:hypothetical protein